MGSGVGKPNGQTDEYEYTHERIVKKVLPRMSRPLNLLKLFLVETTSFNYESKLLYIP